MNNWTREKRLGWTREKRLRSRSEAGTVALGELLTELLRPPKLVVLRGDLGAGKTTLVRGMAAALGAAASEVSSPTFTLVHEYPVNRFQGRRTRLVHLDLYRLETERELEGIGLWEFVDEPETLVMVEWGDKFLSVTERADAEIAIEQGEVENERLLLVRWRE
jgi:tRNA threonylcarbamoyladenosine biosynthesis protein TsaE